MSSTNLTLFDFQKRGENIHTLVEDFYAQRLSSAILIIGADGTGKRTLAALLAKGLLCTENSSKRPCNLCRACKRFDAKTHPDFLTPTLSAKDKSIKVESIRNILDALTRHSFEGGNRVILIEDAQIMTPQAQNCLLKSLEEADENTFFLLTANSESNVLSTIRSRCRLTRLPPLSYDEVEKVLIQKGVSKEEASEFAFASEGSIGKADNLIGNTSYMSLRKLVKESFFSITSPFDVTIKAFPLKNIKDEINDVLDIIEQTLRFSLKDRSFADNLTHVSDKGIMKMLDNVLYARKMRLSNVNTQAIIEWLLEQISEEVTLWQQ